MAKHNNNSNDLIEFITNKQWDNVFKYLHQARFPDSSNAFALHRICSYFTAPIEIVTAIYNAYPIAVFFYENGRTPISIAVDAGFEDAVQFLAKACPQACLLTNYDGSTPLFSAVNKISYSDMIDALIDACPKAAFVKRYNDGNSAFHVFLCLECVCSHIFV